MNEAAQVLLAKQFPHLSRLQTPLFGEKLSFKRPLALFDCSSASPALGHVFKHKLWGGTCCCLWQLISLLDTWMQKANLLFMETKTRLGQVLNGWCVYEEPNCSDCGLFAIACATELAHANNPQVCTWDVSQMQPYFAMCLESGTMQPFPILKVWRQQARKTITDSIYRTPNDSNTAMICCDKCKALYDTECINVHVELDDEMMNRNWFCCNCTLV